MTISEPLGTKAKVCVNLVLYRACQGVATTLRARQPGTSRPQSLALALQMCWRPVLQCGQPSCVLTQRESSNRRSVAVIQQTPCAPPHQLALFRSAYTDLGASRFSVADIAAKLSESKGPIQLCLSALAQFQQARLRSLNVEPISTNLEDDTSADQQSNRGRTKEEQAILHTYRRAATGSHFLDLWPWTKHFDQDDGTSEYDVQKKCMALQTAVSAHDEFMTWPPF